MASFFRAYGSAYVACQTHGNILVWENIDKSCSRSCPAFGKKYDIIIPICPRRPGMPWKVAKRQAAGLLHGILTPARISCSRPHWDACDWAGVPLFSLPVLAKPVAARHFQSVLSLLPFGKSRRTAAHAHAHHNDREEVFGEWVFSFQRPLLFPPHNMETGQGVSAPHPVAHGKARFFPLVLKFFIFFSFFL